MCIPIFISLLRIVIKSTKENGVASNPDRLLEPKHILFYYRINCLFLERKRSGLRQVIKTDKMLIKKLKVVRNNTIVRRTISIVV